jgi:cell division protein FtsI/penicillin-binding protein 2
MMKPELLWRYLFSGAILTILPCLIIVKLVTVQVDEEQRKRIEKEIIYNEYGLDTIERPRGQIYDRNGDLLAGSQVVYEVGVELRQVKNPNAIALATHLVLGEDYARMLGLASVPFADDAVYVPLAQGATQEEVNKLIAMQEEFAKLFSDSNSKDAASLDGLTFRPYLSRIYPERTFASNILGFVSREGMGYYGVEGTYQDRLYVPPFDYYRPLDPTRAERSPEVPEATNLILTIDRRIQASMEDLIDKSVRENGAKSGTILVLDPETGEILAMAVSTRMDLNEFWRYGDIFTQGNPFNRAISETYEPGSVFKILTMGAALDSGTVEPDSPFFDTGMVDIYGGTVVNWNRGAWGQTNMLGCMQHSLNVCLATLAKQMGIPTFYSYMQKFGIGHQTGVDMSGEAAGRLRLPGDTDWFPSEVGYNAFGQGVAVTPLQLATAATAFANDGKMMTPHIVRSMIIKGYQIDIKPVVKGMPVSAQTAHELTELLAQSLEVESSDALVPGYRVAGKTGTAEIPTEGGYTSDQTNASFVGWGPMDDPKFVVYIWLERPSSNPWASIVTAPVFREAVERLVVLMNLPPDDIRHQLLGQ